MRDLGRRVALVSNFAPSELGGVSIHSTNIAERLEDLGYEVARVQLLQTFDEGDYVAVGKNPARLVAAVRRFVGRGFKLWHIHSSRRAYHVYPLVPLLRALGCEVVLSFHAGMGYSTYLQSHPWRVRLNRVLFGYVARILLMNAAEAQRIRELFPRHAERVTSLSPFIAKRYALTETRVGATRPFTIVTIGSYARQYSMEHVAEAVAAEPRLRDYDIHVVVVAAHAYRDADYERELDELPGRAWPTNMRVSVRKNVADIYPVLEGADLFVRASRDDSYGLCVAEALQVGTPAIATDVCTRARGAITYPYGDLRALGSAILEVVEQGERPRRTLLHEEEDSFRQILRVYLETGLSPADVQSRRTAAFDIQRDPR